MTPASLLFGVALAPRRQHVRRDRQQLEGDEHADEVAARRHHHHAEHAAQQQHVVLALVVAALLELGLADQHDDVGGEQEQRLDDQRELVDDVATVEQRAHVVADDTERHDRHERAEQHEPGERGGRPLLGLVDQQVGAEHDVDADDEHQLGREGVPVDRRRLTHSSACGEQPTITARGTPRGCRRAAVTGGIEDLEQQVREHAEDEDEDQHRRPGDPLDGRDVLDVAVVVLVVHRRADGVGGRRR